MVYRIGRTWAAALVFWLAGGFELPAQPIQCFERADIQRNIRAEGLSEFLPDLVFECTGGTPTPPGEPVPASNIQISFNTSVSGGGLLILDDPPPSQHVLCTGACNLAGAGGAGLNYSNPAAPENGGQQLPNVFQGRSAGGNSVTWVSIPLDPPGSVGTRIMRIRNVRANAASVPAGQSILGTIRWPSAGLLFTANLGTVRPGFAFSVGNAPTLNQCLPHNPAEPGPGWNATSTILYSELDPGAFRARGTPAGTIGDPFPPLSDQSALGFDYGTESGYSSTAAPEGAANSGTRFYARFYNVPPAARVFVDSFNTAPGTADAIAIQDCLGEATPAPATNGLVEVPVENQQGAVCFEVFNAAKDLIETLTFGAYLTFGPLGGTATPSLGAVLVELGPAPLAPVPQNRKSAGGPFPVFQSPADPFDFYRRLFIGAKLNSCEPGTPDQFSLITPPVFSEGTFETDGVMGAKEINLLLSTTRDARSVTATPVVGSTTPPQVRSATASWLTVVQSQPVTPVTLTIAVDPAGLSPGTYNGAVRLDSPGDPPLVNQIPIRLIVPPEGPRFGPNGVVGAADYSTGAVAPGQAIVIFGVGYGPPDLVGLALDNNGLVSTALGGVRVLFDGVPSPMIYALDGQVSAFVPFGVGGQLGTELRIENMGVLSPPVFLPVADALPGLFTFDTSGFGQGAILNQNESVNTVDNPAGPGEIVVLYATGAGPTNPPSIDGQLNGPPLAEQTLPARVWIDDIEARIDYYGPAPQLAAGVIQINAEVPAGVRRDQSVPVVLDVGEFRSQSGVTVAIR